jgi:hypothetical protein
MTIHQCEMIYSQESSQTIAFFWQGIRRIRHNKVLAHDAVARNVDQRGLTERCF